MICQALDGRIKKLCGQYCAAGKHHNCPPERRGAYGGESKKHCQQRQGLHAQTSLGSQAVRDTCDTQILIE